MEENLGDLLEELDNAPQGSILTVDGIIKKAPHPDITQKLINEAWKRELIADKYNPLKNEPHTTVPPNIALVLTITGYEFLNQIRIKKSIDNLNESIKNFKDSSDKAYSQLNNSIKKFDESSDKSSKKMILLTYAIYTFTVIVVLLTIIEKILQLFPIDPKYEIVWMIFAVFGTVIAMGVFYYFHEKEDS